MVLVRVRHPPLIIGLGGWSAHPARARVSARPAASLYIGSFLASRAFSSCRIVRCPAACAARGAALLQVCLGNYIGGTTIADPSKYPIPPRIPFSPPRSFSLSPLAISVSGNFSRSMLACSVPGGRSIFEREVIVHRIRPVHAQVRRRCKILGGETSFYGRSTRSRGGDIRGTVSACRRGVARCVRPQGPLHGDVGIGTLCTA